MKRSLYLSDCDVKGYFTKSKDYIDINGKQNEIYHYSIILELSEHCNKLISLYRNVDGQWMEDLAEQDILLRRKLKQQIEKAEKNRLWPI